MKQLALFSSSARVPVDLAPNDYTSTYRKKVNVKTEHLEVIVSVAVQSDSVRLRQDENVKIINCGVKPML